MHPAPVNGHSMLSYSMFIALHPSSDVSRAVAKLDALLQAGAQEPDGFTVREQKIFELQGYRTPRPRPRNQMRQLLQAHCLESTTEREDHVAIRRARNFQHSSLLSSNFWASQMSLNWQCGQ